MKPKLSGLNRSTFAFIAALCVAPSVADTIDLLQSDADSETCYRAPDQNVHRYYELKEDVHFSGYNTPSRYYGNVFYYDGYSFQSNIIMGDADKNFSLKFSNCVHVLSGNGPNSNVSMEGGAASFNSVTFRDLKAVEFTGNYAENGMENARTVWRQYTSAGGAFNCTYLILDNVDLFRIEGNTAVARDTVMGGGIYVGRLRTGQALDDANVQGDNYLEGSGTGDIIIRNNSALTQMLGSNVYGGGIAGLESGESMLFYNTGTVTITGNKAGFHDTIHGTTYHTSKTSGILGGGIYSASSSIRFRNTGSILVSNNTADASGQAYDSNVQGGGICSVYVIFQEVMNHDSSTPSIYFYENSALRNTEGGHNSVATGGAIDTMRLLIEKSGDVLFENNYATDEGGAIRLRMYSGRGFISGLYADEGNITFRGNTHKLGDTNDRSSGIANALFIQENSYKTGDLGLILSANEGRRIEFYDPIQSNVLSDEIFFLSLNEDYDGRIYTGDIVFSGALVEETLAGSEQTADYELRVSESRKSDINAAITLNGGTLVLEEGVTLGRKFDASTPEAGTGATFLMREGSVLDISGSARSGNTTLAAETMTFESGTIRAGDRAFFSAGHIDMSRGITLDLKHYMNGQSFVDLPGIGLSADTITFGGQLTLADNETYYTGSQWAQDNAFVLFHLVHVISGNVTGEFDSIISSLTGSSIIDDPHQYKGEWNLQWEDDKYIAYWTAQGDIETPVPVPGPDPDPEPEPGTDPQPGGQLPDAERRGDLALNSLWSSASNLRTFADAGRSQWGSRRLNPNTNWNYWASGLGDFSRHFSRGSIDGYDYQGGGYAVGADHLFGDKWLGGLSFGHLIGKNSSRQYNAEISQNTLMGQLYGGYFAHMAPHIRLSLEGTAAYGATANKLNDYQADGSHSSGKWDNHSSLLTFETKVDFLLQHGIALSVFAGLEYTYGRQNAFNENGASARRFSNATLQNLALPVGVGIQKNTAFTNGMIWTNGLRLSYIPDIVRENPEADVTGTLEEGSWTARGIRQARNAGRVEFDSHIQLTLNWSAYAGYAFEGRHDSLLHRVHAGVSYSF